MSSRKWSVSLFTGFWLSLILLVFGCDSPTTTSVEPLKDRYSAEPTGDLTPPLNLAGSKVTDFDSLREVLPEIVSASPDERKLEIWYGRRNEWLPQIGSSENLQTYVDHIFKEQVQEGDMGAAAVTKMANGRFCFLDAQYPKAVDHYQEALEISTATDDSVTVGWTYINLTSSMLYLKDLDGAEEYANRALAMAKDLGNDKLEIVAKFAQSGIHIRTGLMERAQLALEEVVRRSRELKISEIEKIGLLNLAYYHIAAKKFDKAIELLTSNPILTRGDVSIVSAIRNMDLYEAYVGKEEYDKAYGYLVEGDSQSELMDYGFGLAFCKKSLAEHYERKGQYELALKAFKEFHDIDEEQAGETARKELQSLKGEQEFLEKDWEIERLTQAEQERALQYRIRRNVMFGGVVGLILIFSLLYFLSKYRARTKLANQNKEMAETKLQVLQSQINPHFIFNALTGIQNSVLKSETIEAYNYLGKFSDILRVMATTATSISIPLINEIELIDNYLALEKLRFRDGFVYSVDVSESLEETHFKVPGMLVQPVVENAIVHGVSNLTYMGKVSVFFQKFGDGVKVIVTDNGRGRKAASIIAQAEAGKHLSIATENSQNTLKALHTIGYKDADIHTLDLFDTDGTSAGTQVTVYLPFLTLTKNT